MYYYMSLCDIPLLTSIELLHECASNFVPWVDPKKFVKIGVLPLFFAWNNGLILCNFWPLLTKSSSIKPLTRNHSYLALRLPRGSCF